MSDFLSDLADTIENQFSLGENTNHTLKLGDFGKRIDQTQQRQYLEQGYLRLDQYNAKPKQLEILFQEPDITVLVKKRAFASLSENFRLDHMDQDEKLFYKATKILFQNKCKQIAALEKLSKIQRVSVEAGQLSSQLIPLIISIVDDISLTGDIISDEILGNTETTLDTDLNKLKNVIEKVRKVYAYGNSAKYTSWLAASTSLSQTLFGQGTGVIELNNITGINTATSVNFGAGQFGLSISDPYNLMTITTFDIEKALSDATNLFYDKKIYQFSKESLDSAIQDAKKRLNDKRALRGVSAIEFIVSPDTLLGKRVRAIIEGTGTEINFTYDAAGGLAELVTGMGGVSISPDSLKGGPEIGDEGLDDAKSKNTTNIETGVSLRRLVSESEVSLFSNVITKIFNDLQLKANSRSITKQNSQLTNYARKKLRLHYGGKLIIQPMDQVHIYINSKTKTDDKVLGGLQDSFTGYGFLKSFNNKFADFKNQFDSLFNPSGNANVQIEKSVFVGSDFPNWLWTLLRNHFVNDTSGAHVFGGVVINSESNYNDGKYTVSVDGKDNTYYLDMGKVNLKPSIDVFNGPLLDPLTPFKTRFDTISSSFKSNTPELLDENKAIINTNFVKFKAGPNAGKKVTETNIVQDRDIQQSFGAIRKVLYAPDGFIYKWKEGIGTFTQFSNAFNVSTDNNIGFPTITKEPFAGQDVMNVISLAITGVPYNYATFYKAARETNGFGRDPQTGEDSARSFYTSLTTDLKKNNLLWGNFIPFKNLVMDEQSFQKVINSQLTILNTNDQIDQKLLQVKDLNNELKFFQGAGAEDSETNALRNSLQQKLSTLKQELDDLYRGVSQQLTDSNQYLSLAGDDVSFNYDEFLNNDTLNKQSLSNSQVRRDLRRKVNFLTRRMAWQVRANEDKNYLIVDDSYDKDYDISAFEKALNDADGMRLFNSDYNTVKEKVETVAKLLNLEVFCDTQGHIRVRPPQYNRMPSSIFYRLIQLKKFSGIQLFPQFIEDLFEDQIQSLISQIEVIEDQIRLDAATLGKATDDSVVLLIRGVLGGGGSALGDPNFTFISEENSGTVLEIKKIFSEKDVDQKAALQNTSFLDTLNGQASLKNVFNTVARAEFLTNDENNVAKTILSSDRINKLISRLTIKTGQKVSLDNFLSPSFSGSVASSPVKEVDAFKITKDLSIKIAERQKIIKLAANALKNAQEAISLDSDDSSTATSLLMPDISRNTAVPEMFENMLEDETYDDYGPNSGKRYIIKNHQIKTMTVREQPPSFNAVEVKGKVDLFGAGDSNQADFNVSILGDGSTGNPLVTAAAVDYDMWRMYGLRLSQPVAVPFLSDAESQCAPFAAALLSRARQNILQARATVVGNEFMQPGDVVYLEDRDLLFYVESVNHNFNYGSNFSTDLVLTYGHSPGDYIPTTLDIIGKLLYKNRDASTYVNFRQNTSFNQQSIGVIVLDRRPSGFGEDFYTSLTQGTYGDHNVKIINDILYTTYFAINSNKDKNSSVKSKIELRIYYDSKQNGIDSNLSSARQIVKNLLTGVSQLEIKTAVGKTDITLSPEDVIISDIANIDVSGEAEFRSPSQKAIDMVRGISGSVSSKEQLSNQLNSTLYGYIIDCWISFENV